MQINGGLSLNVNIAKTAVLILVPFSIMYSGMHGEHICSKKNQKFSFFGQKCHFYPQNTVLLKY